MKRAAFAGFALLLLAAGCDDPDRGGLGPRGTALMPPDPVPEETTPARPAAAQPARVRAAGRAANAAAPAQPAATPAPAAPAAR